MSLLNVPGRTEKEQELGNRIAHGEQ